MTSEESIYNLNKDEGSVSMVSVFRNLTFHRWIIKANTRVKELADKMKTHNQYYHIKPVSHKHLP